MKHSNRVSTYKNKRQSIPNRDTSYEKTMRIIRVTLELEWILCTSSRREGTVHLAKVVRAGYSYISCLTKHGQIGDFSSCHKILPPQVR